jgi:hypothetical protein
MTTYATSGVGGISWGGTVTSASDLANVIGGEAATPAGQFAVAATIQNRLESPGFPDGIANVVTPSNFNGYTTNPSASAQTFANAIVNGNLSDFGETGNATFFSAAQSPYYAQGTASQITAGGTNIGGNLFSDVFGAPTSEFQPPVFGGTSVAPASDADIFGSDVATGEDILGEDDGPGESDAMSEIYGSGDSLTMGSGAASDVYSGDYTSTYTDPNTAFATSTATPGFSAIGVPGGANAPASGATSASGATNSGSGTPIDVTDVTSAGSIAGNAVGTGLNSLGTSVKSAEASAAATGTGWLSSIFGASTDIFVRGALCSWGSSFYWARSSSFGLRAADAFPILSLFASEMASASRFEPCSHAR